MSTEYKKDLAPPLNWQDFEDLCLKLWRPRLVDAKKHGRSGQRQAGVDIFGRDPKTEGWVGIQCKQKGQWPPKELTIAQIEDEIRRAESFQPPLSHFIVATTAQRDVETQEHVRKLSERRSAEGVFTVDLYAWQDLQELRDEQILERKQRRRIVAKITAATLTLLIVAIATYRFFSPGELFEVGAIDYQVERGPDDSLVHHLKVPLLAKEELTVVSAEIQILAARSTQDIGVLGVGQVALNEIDIDQVVRSFRDENEMFAVQREPVAPLRWEPQSVRADEYFVLVYSVKSRNADYCIDVQFEAHLKGDLSKKESWRSKPWVIRPLGLTEEIDPVQWRRELETLPEDLETVLGREPYSKLPRKDRAWYHADTTVLAWVALLKTDKPGASGLVILFRDLLERAGTLRGTLDDGDPRWTWAGRLEASYMATLQRIINDDLLSGDERLELLRSADPEIQRKVAKTVGNAELLSFLGRSSDPEIRIAVAGNRRSPDQILEELTEDSERSVRSALVTKNSPVPVEILKKLSNDVDPGIRRIAQLRLDQGI